MKVYPLIYSRTKFADYVSGFLVRPGDLDHTAAAKYVSDALNEIKHSAGLRHAVFSVGEYIVYGGTACITPALISRILKDKGMDRLDFENIDFHNDKAGRPIVFFIGFAIKRNSIENKNLIPDIDLYETYKIYLKYLQKQWLNNMTRTETLNADDFIDIEVIKGDLKFSPETIYKNGISIIKNYKEDQYQDIINYYFRQSVMRPDIDSSFLSCVLPDMINDSLKFKNISIYGVSAEEYLTRSANIKEESRALQSSESDKTPIIFSSVDEFMSGTSSNTSNTSAQQPKRPNTGAPMVYHSTAEYEQHQKDDDKKKSLPAGRIILIIAITLLVGILLVIATIHNLKKKPTPKAQSENQVQEARVVIPPDNMEQEPIQAFMESAQQAAVPPEQRENQFQGARVLNPTDNMEPELIRTFMESTQQAAVPLIPQDH